MHSDQGRQFESLLVKGICRLLQIKKTRTSPYHPQSDGLVERFNRTLLQMLATCAKANPANWEDHVRAVCFAYNTSSQASTGYSPFYLMYGREARLPIDLTFQNGPRQDVPLSDYARQLQFNLNQAYNLVRSKLGDVQCRQKALYDQKVHGKPFSKGDLVWLHSTVVPSYSCRKLHHPWSGPFKVIETLSDINYKIAPINHTKTFNGPL